MKGSRVPGLASLLTRSATRPVSRILASAIIIALTAVIFVPARPAAAWVTPPAPTLVDVNPSGNEGDWLIGAIPPGYDPAKPVLVFVQGLHGSAQNWWQATAYYGDNDMYAYAYNNGYRTAFVQFADADGAAATMWVNGDTLSQQLKAITEYFGVDRVDIIAHSKGGVDSQTAIVYYGGNQYVRNLITLSSPHYGSPLADLAYSWYGWWLAALTGSLDDGTYVLQTGYMDAYRWLTDYAPESQNVDYCTSGGTDWGPWFSALWFGGSYLSFWGANDGLVPVYSTYLPDGYNIFTADLNHDNIRMGSSSWSRFAPYLSPLSATVSSTESLAATATTAAGTTSAASRGLVRGGAFRGSTSFTFAVENGLSRLEARLLVGTAGATATLTSPSGQQTVFVASSAALAGGTPYDGAYPLEASVQSPASGEWTLSISSKARSDAHVAQLSFPGGVGLTLNKPASLMAPGDLLPLTLTGDLPVDSLNADGVAVSIAPAKGRAPAGRNEPDYGAEARFSFSPVAGAANTWEGALRLPGREGIYNVTIDVKGTLTGGSAFERSLVFSVAVVKPEHRNADGIRGLLGRD